MSDHCTNGERGRTTTEKHKGDKMDISKKKGKSPMHRQGVFGNGCKKMHETLKTQ
jgi:hypothetical protein